MPDLPRRRPPSSSWTQPLRDRLSPLIRALIIAQLAMFAFYKVVPPLRSFLVEHVALGPGALSGEVWQFFTALFVHMDGWSLFFNVIGLWFVGAFTERIHGTRRFLVLLVGAGLLSNLAIAVVGRFLVQMQAFSGASYAILALFVAYGRTYGRAETQVLGSFFLQARLLAAILVGWSLVASISQSPPDGTLFRGDEVTFVVSQGPELVEVPGGLVASGVNAARASLEERGFVVAIEHVDNYLGLGFVYSADPGSGTDLPKGSTVTLWLI